MNITSPILAGAADVAELPGDAVTSFLKMVGTATGLFDDSPDGGLGLAMSALAGVAAALAVAIVLSVYFRSGYRSRRDILKHGVAVTVVLALLAFVVYDIGMRRWPISASTRPNPRSNSKSACRGPRRRPSPIARSNGAPIAFRRLLRCAIACTEHQRAGCSHARFKQFFK